MIEIYYDACKVLHQTSNDLHGMVNLATKQVPSKSGFSQNNNSDLFSILDSGACNDSMLVAYNMRSQIQVNKVNSFDIKNNFTIRLACNIDQ